MENILKPKLREKNFRHDLVTEDVVDSNSAFPTDWQKEITTRSRRSSLFSYQKSRFTILKKINDVLLNEVDVDEELSIFR